jgi:hypothetical protein
MTKRQVIRKRSLFPKCVRQFKELKGICIGECIIKGESVDLPGSKGGAHSHAWLGDPYHGWVCLSYKYQLKEKLVLLHEVAHLIANKAPSTPSHGKKWREAVVSIGGTYEEFLSLNSNRGYPGYPPKKKFEK